MFFRGASVLSLDAKGRFAIPTRYRDEIVELSAGNLVITADPDKCLLIYPTPTWEDIQRDLQKMPALKPHSRDIQRLFIGYATDCEMDAQGRVLVPQPLRDYANLDTQVVLIGQGKKFELWDENRWNEKTKVWQQGGMLRPEDIIDELAHVIL